MSRHALGEKKKRFKPMRLGVYNYKRLCAIRDDIRVEKNNQRLSFDQIMNELITMREIASFSGFWYKVGSRMFRDKAEARGYAIRQSVKRKEALLAPEILSIVGFDDEF